MELQEKKKNRTEQKTDMQNKEKALLTQLDEIAKQDLCLAFSGGVDSSLLQACHGCICKIWNKGLCSNLSDTAASALRPGDSDKSSKGGWRCS